MQVRRRLNCTGSSTAAELLLPTVVATRRIGSAPAIIMATGALRLVTKRFWVIDGLIRVSARWNREGWALGGSAL